MHFVLGAFTLVTSKEIVRETALELFSNPSIFFQCGSSLHTTFTRSLSSSSRPDGSMFCLCCWYPGRLHRVTSQWVAQENDMAAMEHAQARQLLP